LEQRNQSFEVKSSSFKKKKKKKMLLTQAIAVLPTESESMKVAYAFPKSR